MSVYDWNEKARKHLYYHQLLGNKSFLIYPSYEPCRSCGAKSRFAYVAGTCTDGRLFAQRVCTACGDYIGIKKLRIPHDSVPEGYGENFLIINKED